MSKVFYGRKKELIFFENLYNSKNSEFCVLYGRRRVGKTQLCLELVNKYNGIYFLSSEISLKENLIRLKKEFQKALNDDLIEYIEPTIDSLFSYISKKKERILLVVDEFPYLIESDKTFLSEFQRIWDLYLKNSNICLILSGSSISMIEDKVLSYKSPFYGRRTAQYQLNELSFKEVSLFFPKLPFDEILKYYSICGGIPFYLEKINPNLSFRENVKNIFSKGSILYEEGDFLLKQEFRQIQSYKLILREIAKGKIKFNEISQGSSIESTNLTQYLKNLLTLKLIKKEVSFGFDELKSKGRYYLGDFFLEFWFKFIFVNQSLIEEDKIEDLLQIIENNFESYLGFIYEKVVKEFLQDELKTPVMKRWFFREHEIDLVGLREEVLYICECKYKNKKFGIEHFEELKEKSKLIDVKSKDLKYYLFSKYGFSNDFKEEVNLFTNNDLQRWIK